MTSRLLRALQCAALALLACSSWLAAAQPAGDGSGSGPDPDDQDAQAFARFIEKFLNRHGLWNAPKYLFGESDGTTRSAVLVNRLQSVDSIDMNGVMLLSQQLYYGFSPDDPQFDPGNDMPYALALPTFAATAWYHRRLPDWADRSPQTLERLTAAARAFALQQLLPALHAGRQLAAADKHAVAEAMSRFIGLPTAYIERAELRISGGMFSNQLLADDGLTVGRLDTRYSGPSLNRLAKEAAYDPQAAAIGSAYVSAYNDYARNTLQFGTELAYKPYADIGNAWDEKHQPPGSDQPLQGTVNVMPDLVAAMLTNPRLKLAMFAGVYDLATPFFAAEFALDHLPLPPSVRANIETHRYPAGHMMYDDPASLQALHDDVVRFLRSSGAPR